MARKKKGRPINGILILDKPSGITSNAALQKVKWLYQAQKAGHTGSLDPLATGVLPICLGEATKVSHFLLDANKSYIARCVPGAVTTTGDSEGDIIERAAIPILNEMELLSILSRFTGTQEQTPPMYSALKHNGRPLYEYARKGIHIDRKSRKITIYELKLLDFNFSDNVDESYFEIEVSCSKGTYIRSLCEDIGQAIGCGAYISELRRISSQPFILEQAVSLDELQIQYGLYSELPEEQQQKMDSLLLPTDKAIESFPAIEMTNEQYLFIKQGRVIDVVDHNIADFNADYYRLYFNNTLIGLAILEQDNKLKPKRLLFL